jgi:hypothetical protein
LSWDFVPSAIMFSSLSGARGTASFPSGLCDGECNDIVEIIISRKESSSELYTTRGTQQLSTIYHPAWRCKHTC